MTKLFINNITLIATMDSQERELHNCSILIEGPTIQAIGTDLMPPSDAHRIEGSGKIALPGFVNTHHHMFQIYTRDLPRIVHARDLFDRLRIRYQTWHELNAELVYVSALVGLGLLLKTGCTLSSDNHYVFPDTAEKELIDAQIRAAQELGIRFHPTRGAVSPDDSPRALAPRNVCQSDEEILLDCERLITTYYDPSPYSMLRVALAPTNPVTSTTSLMRETIKLARQHGVYCHTHLSESPLEEQWCAEIHGMRLFEYMESLEWVGPDVWYAHCLHLNDEEIKRMGEHRCGLAHCPVSNARNNRGIAPIYEMRERGVRVGFGVDGGAGYGDMLAEMQTAMVVHRYRLGPAAVNAREMLKIATRGGAQVLGWDQVGSLEPGKAADLILIDTQNLRQAGSTHDLLSSLVFFGANHTVNTTIVNGEIVVNEGRLTRIDEEALIERANKLSREFVARAASQTGIDYLSLPTD